MEYHIDCAGLENARELHLLLAQALSFPDYYGHNLDALFDCLCSLPGPVRLILQNWDPAVSWANGFELVLTDAHEENPLFAFEYEK